MMGVVFAIHIPTPGERIVQVLRIYEWMIIICLMIIDK